MQELTEDLLAAEQRCRDAAQQVATDLLGFYSGDSHFYRLAYTRGVPISAAIAPNSATSLIAILLAEWARLPSFADIGPDHKQLLDTIPEVRSAFSTSSEADLLPLRSLGPLPLFSTAMLAEALAGCPAPLQNVALAIATRRLLFTTTLLSRDTMALPPSEPLHPFLIYRISRSLRALDSAIDAFPKDYAAFQQTIIDVSIFDRIIQGIDECYRPPPAILSGIYGNADQDFVKALTTADPEVFRVLLRRQAYTAGQSALTSALSSLAQHSDAARDQADPSALAFALATLSEMTPGHHDNIIRTGIRYLLQAALQGSYTAAWPYYYDDKARTLSVPSIEIASVGLALVLQLRDRLTDEDLDFALTTSAVFQDHILREGQTVEIDGKAYHGWCSDRTRSASRIDSWVTAHVLMFLHRRLQCLDIAKRRAILGSYSHVSSNACKPKWSAIVDPDTFSDPSQPGVMSRILEIVKDDKRTQAPMFLLYGPPGTSKTTLASGLAQKCGWDLITLSPSDFVADSLDRVELHARRIFRDLLHINECVVLFDEMDSLFRDRDLLRNSPNTILEFVVPALLPKLQRLRDQTLTRRMAVFFATNYYEQIDSAIARGGRIDRHFMILPYSPEGGQAVARRFADEMQLVASARLLVSQALERLPCTLGYRDIETLVRAAAKLPPGKVDQVLPSLGVRPAIYHHRRRPNAYPEFCAVLHRAVHEPPTYRRYAALSGEEAMMLIADVLARDGERDQPFLSSSWTDVAQSWVEHLRSQDTILAQDEPTAARKP